MMTRDLKFFSVKNLKFYHLGIIHISLVTYEGRPDQKLLMLACLLNVDLL